VKETAKEAAEKEATVKEAVRREAAEKEDDDERKTNPGHREAVTTTAPLDFTESSVGSSVPFASTICISTRTVYSSTSNT
jgi:hypothetical protein